MGTSRAARFKAPEARIWAANHTRLPTGRPFERLLAVQTPPGHPTPPLTAAGVRDGGPGAAGALLRFEAPADGNGASAHAAAGRTGPQQTAGAATAAARTTLTPGTCGAPILHRWVCSVLWEAAEALGPTSWQQHVTQRQHKHPASRHWVTLLVWASSPPAAVIIAPSPHAVAGSHITLHAHPLPVPSYRPHSSFIPTSLPLLSPAPPVLHAVCS